MGQTSKHPTTADLFRQPLVELTNKRHSLIGLAELIEWLICEMRWSAFFPSKAGRQVASPRLAAGLLYLQHTFARSDKELVLACVAHPYWQYFCAEMYGSPIASSSQARWRQRVAEKEWNGCSAKPSKRPGAARWSKNRASTRSSSARG